MQPRNRTVSQLFSPNRKYRVPIYQRDYVWSTRNWMDLWENIKQKSNLRIDDKRGAKKHFTGAIVIQSDGENVEIIDGQQRLTTFQIIFCAIRDICQKSAELPPGNLTDLPRLIVDCDSSDEQRYKLLPREGVDRNIFQALTKIEEVEMKKTDKGGLIYRTYEHFMRAIEEYIDKDYDKLDKLFNAIIEDFYVVEIMVDENEDPEQIFQTINGTGQALNDFDLLRNNLFLRAGTGTNRDELNRDELYKNHWKNFDQQSFWRERQGKVRDEFLRDFLKAKLGEHFVRDGRGHKLFDQYQRYYKGLPEKSNFVEYEFDELSKYAEVYREIHLNSAPFGQRMDFYKKFNNEFNLRLQLLSSFVLYITNELGMSGAERDQVFDLLESYAIRWILCNSTGSAPVGEINSLFLNILDKQKSLNLLDLWHLFSNQFPGDKEVNSMLAELLPNFNNFNKAPRKRRTKLSRRQKLGRYISDSLKSRIKSPLIASDMDELHKRFCEIWPSPEVLLRSCLKDGLPIVYSRLPVSAEIKPRLDPYKFVTYDGMRELSEYEVQQSNWVGIDAESTSKEKVELPVEKILLAFPITSMSILQPHLNHIEYAVKNQMLTPIPKEESLQVMDWLQLEVKDENRDSKHWPLRNIDATVVTRAGHKLSGKLKSFTDDIIYMELENQIVTVYMHGIYDLNTAAMLKSETYIFMTYNGMRELSKHEMVGDTVVGTNTSTRGNEKVLLDVEEILFAFPVTSMPTLQVHLNNIRDDVKNQGLTSVPKHEPLKFENRQLTKQSEVEIVTRAGHVLHGTVKNVSKEAIFVQIGQETVKVFWHGLHDLEVKSKRQRGSRGSGSGSKMPWQSMIESKKNQPIRFIQGTEIIKLSEITESTRTKITGSYGNEDRIEIQTQDVLFADYSARGKSSDASHRKIWTKVEAPKTQQVEQLSIILKSVNQPNNKFSLKVVTLAGHVLQGHLKSHDKDAIYMDIGRRKVIVFRHGLSALSLIISGDSMLVSESFKFITYDGPIELSQIETGTYELTGIDKSGERLPPLKKLNILFAYPIKAAPNVEPIKIDDQVKDLTLGQTQKDRFQIETSHLESAMAEKIGIRILTRRGHVLEGTIAHFDMYEIHLRIKGQTVIVYRHGIYEFSKSEKIILT